MLSSNGKPVIIENQEKGTDRRNPNYRFVAEQIEELDSTVKVNTGYRERTFSKKTGKEWGSGDASFGWTLMEEVESDEFKIWVYMDHEDYESGVVGFYQDDEKKVFNLEEMRSIARDLEKDDSVHAFSAIDLYGRSHWIWTEEDNDVSVPVFGHQEELEE